MFSTSETHSKDNQDTVIGLQSVAASLTDMKGDLMFVQEGLQDISSDVEAESSRDLEMREIQTLTDTLQNKSAGLLNTSSGLEAERPLEISNFTHHSQSNPVENEISLEAINNPENTITLDHNHYYDGLSSGPIMVYQMASGNIVPFDSLVSVPITKSLEDKTRETVDLLQNTYPNQEVFSNSADSVNHPLYILPDINKLKSQENDKMLISQIYSSEDPANLFLDARQTFVRGNKCEINITDTMNAELNLTSNNFDSSIPISTVSGIPQFPITAAYTSTDTDSEVALTLASLGNLKNDKVRENCQEEPRIFDQTQPEMPSPKEGFDSTPLLGKGGTVSEARRETRPTLVLRSRKGRGSVNNIHDYQNVGGDKVIDTSADVGGKGKNKQKTHLPKSVSRPRIIAKKPEKPQTTLQTTPPSLQATPLLQATPPPLHATALQATPPVETKGTTEPRKENLLGQLLKASKQCEPASLIPEGVVDDVIPAVGYRIMDMSNLSEMIRMMHRCSNTASRGLIVIQEQASLREGAVSQLSIICTGCQEGAVCATSNMSNSHQFDINARVKQLTRECNIEESQVQRMLEILGIFYRPSDQTINVVKPKKETPPEPKEDQEFRKKKRKKTTLQAKEKNVECKVCQQKFSGVNHLKSHMFTHNNQLHTCPYCQAYFKRVFNLQQHIKKHENVKYECDICLKSYSDRSTLYAHKKSFHQEAYKLECEICSKRFFHKMHYVEHMRVHTGEKPFVCTICDKRYPYLSSVKKHMLSHSTMTKYKCRLCGKWFRWLFGIRQHLFHQHKLKKCDIDAQVITEVIAEAVPATTSPNKQLPKALNSSGLRDVRKSETFRLNKSISEEGEEPLEGEKTDTPLEIYSNLSDWKKPLS